MTASAVLLGSVGNGWLATPPADGRILPGIARQRTIETARSAGIEVREESLPLASLDGREVFLAGSVRGIEPVRALDGVSLARPGEISARVAAGLIASGGGWHPGGGCRRGLRPGGSLGSSGVERRRFITWVGRNSCAKL